MATPIAPHDLLDALLGNRPPILIDLRLEEDVADDPRRLPRSRPMSHRHLGEAPVAADREVVAVCQKGLKISQGAAAWLLADGRPARYLEDGTLGWDGPTTAMAALPPTGLWAVADDRDGLVCDWLVHRFAPEGHCVLRVASDQRDAVGARFDARPVAGATDLAEALDLAWPPLLTLLDRISAGALDLPLGGAPRRDGTATARIVLDAALEACR